MSKLKPEWGTPLRPYTKYKLREQVKNAWRLSDRSKTFVRKLVTQFPVKSVGDGTAIGIEFIKNSGKKSIYVDVNATENSVRITRFSDGGQEEIKFTLYHREDAEDRILFVLKLIKNHLLDTSILTLLEETNWRKGS